jgi:sortase A
MWRRAARILSVALITAGVVILTDAAVTLAWKEPLSSVYGSIKQSAAGGQLDELEERFLADPAVTDVTASTEADVERKAKKLASIYADEIKDGEGIGRIEIPPIGADFVVIQGTDTADLQKGPGHYPDTGLPGQGRTIGIAGHRTTYLAPFRKIANIEVGDEVKLEMPYGKFTYEVTKTDVVDPSETDVVDDTGSERLVLTACHPLYSAAQRYVVTAELSGIDLVR